MMPSRGLQAARGNAPRLFQQQCRNLSSRHAPRASPIRLAQTSLRAPQWRTQIPTAAFSISTARYASTSPTPPPPAADAASAAPTPQNLDTITIDDLNLTDLTTTIPEGIGQLHALGINFGYGMTSTLQWTLEHLHVWGGLPWWGAIAATAVLTRAILSPFFIASADQNARMQAMMAVTKPIQDRMSAAQQAKDQTAVMEAWAEMNAIRKRAGLSYTRQFAPLIAQGYIGFCGFRLLRAMATLPVPGFHTGGFLWLQDLTIPDGYLLLPVMMGISMHMMGRWGGESGSASSALMTPAMRNIMLYGMPFIVTVITGWQPGAIAIWFAVTGAWGLTQARVLQTPSVRHALGIAPIYRPPLPPTTAAGSNKTINTTATISTPGGGTYQSPNLRGPNGQPLRSPASAQPNPSPTTLNQPAPAPAGNILERAKNSFNDAREKLNDFIEDKKKKAKAVTEEEFKRSRVAEYERRSREKREREKMERKGKGGRKR